VQLRRNIEQLYALHQIGQAIGSSLSLAEVIRVSTWTCAGCAVRKHP